MRLHAVLIPVCWLISSVLVGQESPPQPPAMLDTQGAGHRFAATTDSRARRSPVTLAKPHASSSGSHPSCKLYTFEGLPNYRQIPPFDGITATGWYSGISFASGGTANFVNNPSGATSAVFYTGGSNDIVFSSAVGSVRYYYATAYATVLTAYDGNGNVVASETVPPNWDGNPYYYDVWTQIPPLEAPGNVIRRINLQSAGPVLNNFLAIDDLEVCGAVTIAGVEMTQAIQQYQTLFDLETSLANTHEPPVPIIAGKPGVMRVYTSPPQELKSVSMELNIPGVFDLNKTVTLVPGCTSTKQRNVTNGCLSTDFYFTPPSGSWTATITVTDPDTGSIIEQEALPFQSRTTNPLVLKGVTVCSWIIGAAFGDCGFSSEMLNNMTMLTAMAPTGIVTPLATSNMVPIDLASTQAPPGGLPPGDTLDDVWWQKVNLALTKMFIENDAESDPLYGLRTTYFGTIKEGIAPGCCIGLAYHIPSHAASAWNHSHQWGIDLGTYLVAHETGHTEGLKHTNVKEPYNPPGPEGCWLKAGEPHSDWPFVNNYIQSQATYEVGFDVAARKAVAPLKHFEIMGYCYPPWITPQRYKTLINTLGGGTVTTPSSVQTALSPEVRQAKPHTTATQPFWMVSGMISPSGAVQFEPMFQRVLAGDTSGGSGTYSLVVQNAAGAALFTQYVTPGEGTDYPDTAPPQAQSFAALVPVTAGAAQIVLQDPVNATLASVTLGGVAPTVAITNPTSAFDGTTPVSWTITDPDSTTFDSRVLYSADNGNTWSQIGEVPNSGTSFLADFTHLPGTNGQGLIQVLVSDGVNTGAATSARFSIPKKTPSLVQITAPAPGTAQPASDAVLLMGVGYDADDGTLTGNALAWSSNLDGALGNGARLAVQLQPGIHTITLTATDSDGNSISTSETITMALQTPTLNVGIATLNMPPNGNSTCAVATLNAAPAAYGAPLSAVQYSVDGGDTYTNVPLNLLPYSFYIPGTGLISLLVEAIDTSGQIWAQSGNYFNLYPCGSLTVPNVVGQTQTAAASAITGAKLTVGTVTAGASNSIPSGSVMSQSPAAGASVGPGSAVNVNLVVSSGAQVGVPNVAGMAQADAAAAITSAGLTVGTVSNASSATIPFGEAVSEAPAAGTLVNAGAAVNLVISSGPSLAITSPAVLPIGTAGSVYEPTTMAATGGSGIYTWSASGLPDGLSIVATTDGVTTTTGVITGTPSSNSGSLFAVMVTVTDSNSVTVSKSFNLVVKPALVLSGPGSLPGGTAGQAYAATTFGASGGSAPYTFTATGLPAGMKIDAASGVISGTPASSLGSPFNVQVFLTDSNRAVKSASYSLTVAPAAGNRCDITGDGLITVADVSLAVSGDLQASAKYDLNNDGLLNVVDIQILINAAVTQVCGAI